MDLLSVGLVGLEPQELDKLALVRAVLHHAELDALAEFLPELDVRVLLKTGQQHPIPDTWQITLWMSQACTVFLMPPANTYIRADSNRKITR